MRMFWRNFYGNLPEDRFQRLKYRKLYLIIHGRKREIRISRKVVLVFLLMNV